MPHTEYVPHPATYTPAPAGDNWRTKLDARSIEELSAAEHYVTHTPNAGFPGHSMIFLLHNLATWLDAYENHIEALENELRKANSHMTVLTVDNIAPTYTALERMERPSNTDSNSNSVIPTLPPAPPPPPATEKQINAIYAIGHAKGWTDAELEDQIAERYASHPNGLSRIDASDMIDFLKSQQKPQSSHER